MADFANLNLPGFFNKVYAPGDAWQMQALKFYQDQLRRNQAGKGLAQVAAARVPNAGVQPWQAATNPDAAAQAYQQLLGSNAAAKQTALSTGSDVETGALGGALSASDEFANSLTSKLFGDIRMNQAQSSNIFGGLDNIMSLANNGINLYKGGSSLFGGGSPTASSASGGGASPIGSGVGPSLLPGSTGSTGFGSSTGPFSLLSDPTATDFLGLTGSSMSPGSMMGIPSNNKSKDPLFGTGPFSLLPKGSMDWFPRMPNFIPGGDAGAAGGIGGALYGALSMIPTAAAA